jgi:excisionase family DNA binding protein
MTPQTRKLLSKPSCTVDEFAALMGLSRNAAYVAVQRGDVRVLRFGRRIVIPTRQLRAMLDLEETPRKGAA